MQTECFNNESNFSAALSRLSAYRREKIFKSKHNADKILSLAAGYLIDIGLREYNLCERDMKYVLNANKKPYFAEYGNIFFNVSHSGNYAVCVFSDTEVGCDIETVRGYKEGLLNRFFSHNEQEAVIGSANPAYEFIGFWTRKESFLKATGEGITRTLSDIDTTANLIEENGAEYYFREYNVFADARICVCKRNGVFETEPKLVTPRYRL